MGSIGRYIFRTTLGAFLTVIISLTAVIWITQALREFDLITRQGQSFFVFIGITGLTIPMLMLVIAPIALFIATAHTLNKLSTDSEIIVMNAAGMSPLRLFQCFISVTALVSIFIAVLGAYVAPKGMRVLRDWITEVRANLISNIVQPGRFVGVEAAVTFHIRARSPTGQLLGVFMDDRRNPSERVTILADSGELLENDRGTFLVLKSGTIQRYESSQREPNMVVFDRYALDLSRFAGGPQNVRYSIREQYLWQMLFPDPKNPWLIEKPDHFRAELMDRLIAPVYPFAFVIIAFAFLGTPQTTRQSRTLSLIGAIACMGILRLIGFASTVFGTNFPALLAIQYVAAAGAIGVGLLVIHRGLVISSPQSNIIDRLTSRFASP
jgi:lipopolysaccharide export system permease protein